MIAAESYHVGVNLSKTGLAALDVIVATDGYENREAAIIGILACTAEGLGQSWSDEGQDGLRVQFAPDTEEISERVTGLN